MILSSELTTRIRALYEAGNRLPTCTSCGHIEIDGEWVLAPRAAFTVIKAHAELSQSICPACADERQRDADVRGHGSKLTVTAGSRGRTGRDALFAGEVTRRIIATYEDGDYLTVCAWCKRVEFDGAWHRAPVFALAAIDAPNTLSHAICPPCGVIQMAELA